MSLYLRLSVTDRCNFHCRYCRPTGSTGPARRTPLADGDILALVERLHAHRPLRKIRLTGGEPLLRPGLEGLVAELRRHLPETELCLTTNGYRLARQAEGLRRAGVDRLNVSLDSLRQARFAALTGVDGLDRVVEGMHAARRAGFAPLKLNAVLMRSATAAELSDMLRFAAGLEAELRFIELMPLGVARRLYEREYLPADQALQALCAAHEHLGPLEGSGTASRHRFRVDGREVVLGLITPISDPFCGRCDRLRLDSRGRLLACLRREDGVPLAESLQRGDLEELDRRIEAVVRGKGLPEACWSRSDMASIGG